MNNVLESGASTVAKDGDGDTPLHIAAYRVQTEICSSLLLKGADKDGFDDRRRTPRYLAPSRVAWMLFWLFWLPARSSAFGAANLRPS